MKKNLFLVLVVLTSVFSYAKQVSSFENIKVDYTISLYDFWLKSKTLINQGVKKSELNTTTSLPLGAIFQVYAGTKTLADLEVVGSNLKWYNSSDNLLPDSSELIDGTTYKVTQTIDGIESESLFISVKKISESFQNYCVGATVFDLVSTPSSSGIVHWFSNSTGGTALLPSEVLTSNTYYAQQVTSRSSFSLGSGLNNALALTSNTAGDLFIGQNNSPIIKMDTNGNTLASLGTSFNNPEDIVLDSFGNLYIANTGDNAIQKINAAGDTVTTIATINSPKGIALDNLGNLFVTGTDNYDYIIKMDTDGNNNTTIGNGFYFPQGVAVDAFGNVYIADTYNQEVKKMNANGENIITVGSGFNYPRKIKFDSLGNIYVLDSEGIKKMDSNGNNIQIIDTGSLSLNDFTVDSLGNVIATNDSALIKKPVPVASNRVGVSVNVSNPPIGAINQIFIDGDTLSDLEISGNDLKWFDSFGTLISNSTALIDEAIYGVTQTINGSESCTLYVTVNEISTAQQNLCGTATISDLVSTTSANSIVSWFNAANGGVPLQNSDLLTANTYFVQQATFSTPVNIGNDLNFPQAITSDTSGTIYVLDFNSIKKIDSNGIIVATISLGFDSPRGIAVDATGNIYIADTNNNRIVKMDSNGNNATNLGYGFYLPISIALDNEGNIFVIQNNSIVKMDSSGNNLQTIANNSLNFPLRLTLDSVGNIYVIENYTNFIKKLDSNGNFLGYIDGGFNFLVDIDVDSAGTIYLLTENNGVIGLDADGNTIFALDIASNNLKGLVVDLTGSIFVTNDFTILKTALINSNRVPVSVTISSPVFTQVAPIIKGQTLLPLPTTSENNIVGTWSPEINNTETTTYTFTPEFGGCEATMTIIVNSNVPNFTQIEPICSGETLNALPTTSNNGIEGTWSPEINTLETTIYTFTPNAEGISTVTMTIIVNPSSINTTTVSSCDSYFWENNGETYTTSGTYTGTTVNCMTEKLELTINKSSSNTTAVSACESFTWETPQGNGQTYTSSQAGINSVSTNGAGCPHIETLNLTIIPRPDAPIVACYESAEFDNLTCQWNIVGEQPAQPTELACYESVGTFNTETCQWNIIGEQPAQPTELACYESIGTFNTETCQWNIVGEQPVEPLASNCWDDYVFDAENCSWLNIGVQPSTPLVQSIQNFNLGSIVSNLVATGSNLKWYNQANGGNVLASNSILTSGTYYVSQTINGCESERASIEVTLTSVLCSGATVSNLEFIGGVNLKWYSSITAITPLSSTSLLSTRIYYFTQTIEGIQTPRTSVSVTIDLLSNATSISGASGTICYNSGKILSLNSTNVRGTIQWYSSNLVTGPFVPISGATASTLDTGDLSATTFYNAVVTNGVCHSKTTAIATVTVRPQSIAGTISGGGVSVCSGTNSTVLTLSGQLGSIQWQSSTDNENFVTIPARTGLTFSATNLTTSTYFRSMITNGVGCIPVASNSVVVNVKSLPNSGIILGASTIPYNAKATLELTNFEAGSSLQWKYGSPLSGIYYFAGQVNSTSSIYTTGRLTKDFYYIVTVTKDGCSSNTAPFLVDVSSRAKLEDLNASSDGTQFNVIAYPNPSSESFTIQTSSKGVINVKVYDMQWRLIENRQENTKSIQVGSRYATGTYNVIVTQGAEMKTLRLIKK